MAMTKDDLKKLAAAKAAEQVRSGMALGLGTGSTAKHFINMVGEKYKSGELTDLVAIATSVRSVELARSWGIPLVSFDTHPVLDLAVDGTDEIDPQLNLIKGRGAAMLWEKVVATAAKRFIIISDDSKNVTILGSLAPVPVEVIPFAADAVRPYLEGLGCEAILRQNDHGEAVRTDENNVIFDCRFDSIDDPQRLDQLIKQRTGVVEHGLFIDMATSAIIAGNGEITVVSRETE